MNCWWNAVYKLGGWSGEWGTGVQAGDDQVTGERKEKPETIGLFFTKDILAGDSRKSTGLKKKKKKVKT